MAKEAEVAMLWDYKNNITGPWHNLICKLQASRAFCQWLYSLNQQRYRAASCSSKDT